PREQGRARTRPRRARRVRPGDRVAAGEGGDPAPPGRRARLPRERVDEVVERRPHRAGGGLDDLPALHGAGGALRPPDPAPGPRRVRRRARVPDRSDAEPTTPAALARRARRRWPDALGALLALACATYYVAHN